MRNTQVFHNSCLASTSYVQASSHVVLSPSRSTGSLLPCYCLFLDDLWLTKSCRDKVISPTRTCRVPVENEFGHLQTSLVRLKVDSCFLSQSSFMVFCIPLVRVREEAHIRRSRMRSPDELLLPPVLCTSEVSESSHERHRGRRTLGTPWVRCLENSSPSSHASLDSGYLPKLARSLW